MACARSICSCPKYGISALAFARLNAITSSMVRTETVVPRSARYAFTPALNSYSITSSSASSYLPTVGTLAGSTITAPALRSDSIARSNAASVMG